MAGDPVTSGGGAEEEGQAAPRRRGRPARRVAAAGPGTRERILSSARTEFAERGYDRASIRGIARGAGVDPALVHHYLGNKEQLFTAAVEGAMTPVQAVPAAVFEGSLDTLGERMARAMFGVWENEVTRGPLLAIVRSAVNNETAADLFRQLVTRNLLGRIAGELDLPDVELRVELAVAQLVGVMLMRYVIKLEPVASEPVEQLVARLAPVIQQHLTGGAPEATTGADA